MSLTLAIDAMGGDLGISATVPASLDALTRHPDLHILLTGDESALKAALQGKSYDQSRLTLISTTQVVTMDDPPAQALRGKKDSSMRVAINQVKSGAAAACVSAGNTGALMATARFVLKTLPGIDRPAICSELPTRTGRVLMLDLGGNVDCSAAHLHQFAVMGAELARAVGGLDNPRIGLLNIGAEDIKGNEQIRATHPLLESSQLNYLGFIEADQVYSGSVDVVVCDGFVGNVALKSMEGAAKMIAHFMSEAFRKNLFTRLCAIAAMPVLKRLRGRIDPRRYNGASFLGLQGIVIKSHGGADSLSFANAIDIGVLEARQDVPNRIHHQISAHWQE